MIPKYDFNKFISCFDRWLKIRCQESKSSVNSVLCDNILSDAHHSSLLRRLLDDKNPFDRPPPLSYSHPWYDLIENGLSHNCDVNIKIDGRISINQNSTQWIIKEKISDNVYIVLCITNDKKYTLKKNDHQSFLIKGKQEQIISKSEHWSLVEISETQHQLDYQI